MSYACSAASELSSEVLQLAFIMAWLAVAGAGVGTVPTAVAAAGWCARASASPCSIFQGCVYSRMGSQVPMKAVELQVLICRALESCSGWRHTMLILHHPDTSATSLQTSATLSQFVFVFV